MTQRTEKAVRVRIGGRVQGVFFRAWTKEQAQRLGLRGWVRNRHDGTVEAMFAGPADAVDRMIVRCREGPPQAHVTEIEVTPARADDSRTFDIRPSV